MRAAPQCDNTLILSERQSVHPASLNVDETRHLGDGSERGWRCRVRGGSRVYGRSTSTLRLFAHSFIYVLRLAAANYVRFGHCYEPGRAAQVACVVNSQRANCFYFRRTSPSFRVELRARRNSIFKYRIIPRGGTAHGDASQQRVNNVAVCVWSECVPSSCHSAAKTTDAETRF